MTSIEKKSSNRNIIFIGGLFVIIILAFALYYYDSGDSEPIRNDGTVFFGNYSVSVEIADNPEDRSQGLMFRESMPRNTGMLFVFEDEGIYSFWMKNVEFNLDMIWIDSSGEVVHIEENVPTCSEICPSYTSLRRARFVLEVNAGYVNEINLVKGSIAEIFIT
jgi:uncharacterized membrane protein (UPF0127 family)